MAKARVFRYGNSQAVRLPKELGLTADEVEIFRRGREIILIEKPRGMRGAFDLITGLPEKVFGGRDGRPQERDGV